MFICLICWLSQILEILIIKKFFTKCHKTFPERMTNHLEIINSLSLKVLEPWRKIVSEYDQKIPQSQTADNPMATITRQQEDKLSKVTSSLFPIKMIAILERTKSNVQQNIEQLQTPTMGETINKTSTTEPPP